MSDIVKARYEAFGCAGQASKIKVLGPKRWRSVFSRGIDQDFLIMNGETRVSPSSSTCLIKFSLLYPAVSRFDCVTCLAPEWFQSKFGGARFDECI